MKNRRSVGGISSELLSVLTLFVVLLVPLFLYAGIKFKEGENSRIAGEGNIPSVITTISVLPSSVVQTVAPSVTPSPSQSSTQAVPDNNNFGKDYDHKPVAQRKGTVRIPILTYHHIASLPKKSSEKPYYVTPEIFEKQLAYLKEKNYKTVTSEEFYKQLKSGKNPKQKTVMLTFDDGNLDNYTNAFRLLKKYGFVGVFYVNSKRLKISTTRLKEMSDAGMVIDSHTATHIDLKKENNQKVLDTEIITSRWALEGITKKTIYSVSYPGCVYDQQVVNTVIRAGYKFGVSCGKSIDHSPSSVYAISRMHIYNSFSHFKKVLSGIWTTP